jgi:tryptophan synthase alpha chain
MGKILAMNRIDAVFQEKKDVLNIYFTAGYPQFHDTLRIAKSLEEAGADMLEIGIPFSDPLADGPTIQNSSMEALNNGMSITELFKQLSGLRQHTSLPVLLMGYINPILQFGIEAFVEECQRCEIDGIIVPDLPMQEYLDDYRSLFSEKGIHNIFLISPNTSEERIRLIDKETNGFIYMVSSSSITGAKTAMQEGQIEYYERIQQMNLANPRLIGFGISNHESFLKACEYADGAIIGSAFINELKKNASDENIISFVQSIKGKL